MLSGAEPCTASSMNGARGTVVLMPDPILGLRRFFFFFLRCIVARFSTDRHFLTVYDSIALRAHGLRRLLRRAKYILVLIFVYLCLVGGSRVPNRIIYMQVGSGPGGTRRAKQGPVLFSRFFMENSNPRNLPVCIYHTSDNVTLTYLRYGV